MFAYLLLVVCMLSIWIEVVRDQAGAMEWTLSQKRLANAFETGTSEFKLHLPLLKCELGILKKCLFNSLISLKINDFTHLTIST